ncbi:MAG TPA: 23S rRNA (adenine(2503)-C(2))-methyltransferase RlmN [Verrucomicrobiota bacterium]|nr:23S rRNA (adenine(2503)-C(2))-methyltransferase RlmN [Verrucomicrobiota bacterium]HNU51468.1 23S rRNA (adenine(2503)-C(2))-methyltransferase RlmN [Verrucomicrobiota bacterium]
MSEPSPIPPAPRLRDVRSQTLEELQAEFQNWQEPAYRASQVVEWLYVHRATDWTAMSNLPLRLRERLRHNFALDPITLVAHQGSPDHTQKFLWRLADGALIESVLIPANPALCGEESDRRTLCVSTQVGCAYGCAFCASGLQGWKRNLGVEEIVDQVLAAERWHAANPAPADAASPRERLVDNLVIMGMGEPLANYDPLLKALRILNAPWGGRIGARRITVSTSGLCPQIRRLAEEPLQLQLAVSLHGATDPVRSRLMPVNRKYPIRELMAACEFYVARKGRLLTFEYLLIAGVNDDLAHVPPLADLARRVHAKVNLIPYNHVPTLPWQRPDDNTQQAFLEALQARGINATLRREKGHDIDAACGQLRLRAEAGNA